MLISLYKGVSISCIQKTIFFIVFRGNSAGGDIPSRKHFLLMPFQGEVNSVRLLCLKQLISEAPVIEYANIPVKPVQIPS